ncbi:MAG TPA: creatininase family protein [Gemmatimonadales bacterium]|nr:creatininase family protein [Gemmatimonadales bacterium]
MPTRELAAMTWEEVRDLDKGRAVAVLPVGAVEAHGPHLPLITDVIIAEAMARAGAERLVAAGYEPVLLPSLVYTAAEFGAGFAGTISLRPATVTAVLADIAASLARAGFRALAVANAHLDPAHLASLRAAAAMIRAEQGVRVVVPDVARKPWALRLTEEFKSGACHAGRYEGSIVLAERPELVRQEIARELPPNPASLAAAIREGKKTFAEARGPRAYFGYPAEATREEGEITVEILGSILADAVAAGLRGES